VSSAHLFNVEPGEPVQISVVAWEKDWVTTPMERRLAVDYRSQPTTSVELEAAIALREHRSPRTLGVIRHGWAWLL
jgi:hypothetical protein